MAQNIEVEIMEDVEDLSKCFAVMKELRPNLTDAISFIRQAERQRNHGYCLSAAWCDGKVIGVIGYRLQENFLHGRHIFVDDLVVSEDFRDAGVGAQMLSAVRAYAREARCCHVVLETGLDKVLAQRFYFRQGMLPHAIGFSEGLFESDEDPHK